MNPFDPALLERLCAEAAPPPAPSSLPAPNGWRSSVYAEVQPGCLPRWKADWSVSDEDGLAEWLELADLSDLTAEVGSWEAARTLFAPNTTCAGLYATQTPEPCPSRVSYPRTLTDHLSPSRPTHRRRPTDDRDHPHRDHRRRRGSAAPLVPRPRLHLRRPQPRP